MRKILLAGVATLALTTAAYAVPIAPLSEVSLNGSDTFTATATTFTLNFLNPGNVGGATGSFTALTPLPANGAATFIATLTEASSNFQLYTATVGAVTSTLVAATINSFAFTPGTPLESLEIKGTGTLTLTGFDSTAGSWDLTTQGPGGTATVTFSNTAVTTGVPEPASLALLGGALSMLGLYRWRRRRN